MLDFSIPTIILEIVNFLVLAALLYRFLFKKVIESVENRAREKERLLRELEENRQESARIRAELEERLASIDQEIRSMLDEAQAHLDGERGKVLEEVHKEAERILSEAYTETKRIQKLATTDFQDDLAKAIMSLSLAVITRSAPPELHDTMVKQVSERIWELGRSDMRQVEIVRQSLSDRSPLVHVQTARPLTEEQQRELARTFSALADHQIELEIENKPDLAAGMSVRIGDLIVDNTLSSQMDAFREDIALSVKERFNE